LSGKTDKTNHIRVPSEKFFLTTKPAGQNNQNRTFRGDSTMEIKNNSAENPMTPHSDNSRTQHANRIFEALHADLL
jgi:hypothetical protein